MTSLNFNSYLLKKIALEGSTFGVLTANKFDQYQGVSAFDSAKLDDLKNLDIEKLLKADDSLDAVDENATADQKALAEMVKAFLEIDDVKKAADEDGDGELSSEEALKFLQSAMAFDGDLTTLTMEDLDKVVQSLNIDLNDVIDKAIEDSLDLDEIDKAKQLNQTNSATGAGGSYGGVSSSGGVGSNSGTSATKEKTTAETVAELEQKIKDKEDEISDVEEDAEKEIQEQEEAKKKAMEDAGVSEKEYKEYKEKEEKIEKSISETDKEISEHNNTISENEATISSNENYISSIESEISNNQTALSAVTGDDADSKKSSIQEKINNLESKKSSVESENKKLEEANAKEKEKIQTAEAKKKELETQKQELLKKTLEGSEGFAKGKTADEAASTQKEIAAFDTKITEIRNKKDEKIASLRSDIQELNVQLKDAKEKEERTSFLKENSFLAGEDVLELAKKFEGKTQAEMREIMSSAGYQFDDGAWCADFVSYIASQTLGEENLPDWYKNCNRAYCPDIMSNAKSNGAFVGAEQAQPGDAVLFDWDGDGVADHIGYVTNINGDGTIDTIEGNTSGGNAGSQVASKKRNNANVLGYVKLT